MFRNKNKNILVPFATCVVLYIIYLVDVTKDKTIIGSIDHKSHYIDKNLTRTINWFSY